MTSWDEHETGVQRSLQTLLSGLRVLVVDDEADVREITSRMLRNARAEVCMADGVPAALQMLERTTFDLVLSDIVMPGQGGRELAALVRARFGGAQPLLALSGLSSPEDQRRALEAGFWAYLVKPVTEAVLCTAVYELSARRLLGATTQP